MPGTEKHWLLWPRKSLIFQYSMLLFQTVRELTYFIYWIIFSSTRLRSVATATTTAELCNLQRKTQSYRVSAVWIIVCLEASSYPSHGDASYRLWFLHSWIEYNRVGSESFKSWKGPSFNPNSTTVCIALINIIILYKDSISKEITDFWWNGAIFIYVSDLN